MNTEATNNEIRIEEINRQLTKCTDVIKHCATRSEAEDIQEEMATLEEEKDEIKPNPMCKKYPDSEVLPDEKGNCSLCGGDCNENKED